MEQCRGGGGGEGRGEDEEMDGRKGKRGKEEKG